MKGTRTLVLVCACVVFAAGAAYVAYASLKHAPAGTPAPSGVAAAGEAPAVAPTPGQLAACERLPRPPASPAPRTAAAGPIISINFDDGFLSAYQYGIPLFNAAGFPVTAYVISGDLTRAGRMDLTQVKALASAGNEIGAHTITHPLLTQVPEAQAITEVCGSRQALLSLGIDTTTFAYPDGYTDSAVESIVQAAGFSGARNTKAGLNTALTDPYELRSYQVTASTTLPMLEYAIAQAAGTKEWLIITFHRVDDPGNPISVPHTFIEGLIAYLKTAGIPVVTNAEGLALKRRIAGTQSDLRDLPVTPRA